MIKASEAQNLMYHHKENFDRILGEIEYTIFSAATKGKGEVTVTVPESLYEEITTRLRESDFSVTYAEGKTKLTIEWTALPF